MMKERRCITMPELLVKINNNVNEALPPEEQGALYKEGDVVVIRPDGWNWGIKERQNFLVVPIDEPLTDEEIQAITSESWEPRPLREHEKGKVFRPNPLIDTPEEVKADEDQFQADLLMATTQEARDQLIENRPPERPVQLMRRRDYTIDVPTLAAQEELDLAKLKERDVEYQPFIHPAGTIVEKKTSNPLPGSPGMLMEDESINVHKPTRDLQKKSLPLAGVLKRKVELPVQDVPGQKPAAKSNVPVGKLVELEVKE